MSSVMEVAAAAGPGVGAGLGAWGGLRFLRWAIEFVYRRMDIRAARLDDREKLLESRFNDRLRHVEQELELYRTATMRLVNRIAEIMPQDPVLGEVAKILRQSVTLPSPNSDLDELARRAGDALDGAARA